jgi:hypothetical protein
MSAKRRRPWRQSIDGQFAPRRIEMLESPAYRVLSLSARKVLDRIEIELAHHGGNDNGRLPVTYDDFEHYGIERRAIPLAIREAVALGFLEITAQGRGGNAEFRSPSKYRLTFRHLDRAKPTDEWRRIQTIDEAQALARLARINRKTPKQNPMGENANFQGGTPPKTGNPQGENGPTASGGKTGLLSISRFAGVHRLPDVNLYH